MQRETSIESDGESALHRRSVTLADGRYLIFYTFDAGDAPRVEKADMTGREPQAEQVAEEERRV
jgi:hypothetical protein